MRFSGPTCSRHSRRRRSLQRRPQGSPRRQPSPRCLHDGLIDLVAHPAERAPADLVGPETLLLQCEQMLREWSRVLHEERGVGFHAVSVTSSKESPYRLPHGLAEQVPQRHVHAAYGVGDRAPATLPEGILVKFLAHTFRLKCVLALVE